MASPLTVSNYQVALEPTKKATNPTAAVTSTAPTINAIKAKVEAAKTSPPATSGAAATARQAASNTSNASRSQPDLSKSAAYATVRAPQAIKDEAAQAGGDVVNAAAQVARVPIGVGQAVIKIATALPMMAEAFVPSGEGAIPNLNREAYDASRAEINAKYDIDNAYARYEAGEINNRQYNEIAEAWQSEVNTAQEANTTYEDANNRPVTNWVRGAMTDSDAWIPAPTTPAAQVVAKVSDALGEAIPVAALSVATGGTSSILTGTAASYVAGGLNAAGTEMAERSGDVGQAITSGVIEAGTEVLGGKLFGGVEKLASPALRLGLGAVGEGVEEVIGGTAQTLLEGGSVTDYLANNALEEFAIGTAVGGILQGGTNALSGVHLGGSKSETNVSASSSVSPDLRATREISQVGLSEVSPDIEAFTGSLVSDNKIDYNLAQQGKSQADFTTQTEPKASAALAETQAANRATEFSVKAEQSPEIAAMLKDVEVNKALDSGLAAMGKTQSDFSTATPVTAKPKATPAPISEKLSPDWNSFASEAVNAELRNMDVDARLDAGLAEMGKAQSDFKTPATEKAAVQPSMISEKLSPGWNSFASEDVNSAIQDADVNARLDAGLNAMGETQQSVVSRLGPLEVTPKIENNRNELSLAETAHSLNLFVSPEVEAFARDSALSNVIDYNLANRVEPAKIDNYAAEMADAFEPSAEFADVLRDLDTDLRINANTEARPQVDNTPVEPVVAESSVHLPAETEIQPAVGESVEPADPITTADPELDENEGTNPPHEKEPYDPPPVQLQPEPETVHRGTALKEIDPRVLEQYDVDGMSFEAIEFLEQSLAEEDAQRAADEQAAADAEAALEKKLADEADRKALSDAPIDSGLDATLDSMSTDFFLDLMNAAVKAAAKQEVETAPTPTTQPGVETQASPSNVETNPTIQTESKPETESNIKPVSFPVPQPFPKSTPSPQAQPETEVEKQAQAQPQVQVQTQAQTAPQAQPRPMEQPQAQPQPLAQPLAEAQPMAQPEPQTQPQPEIETSMEQITTVGTATIDSLRDRDRFNTNSFDLLKGSGATGLVHETQKYIQAFNATEGY